jgi:hypothetical protein
MTTGCLHWSAVYRHSLPNRLSLSSTYFRNSPPSSCLLLLLQAVAIAQTDFEALFESLKAAAQPGAPQRLFVVVERATISQLCCRCRVFFCCCTDDGR